ncbi:hypothetical protein Dimus_033289 [Dionaea muscipula]
MAKRGRPRKRDGLSREDLSTRASIVGSAAARSEKGLPEGEVHDCSDNHADVQNALEDWGNLTRNGENSLPVKSNPPHSLHNKRHVEKKFLSEKWIPARKPALAVGGACCPVSSKKGESSGSRFFMLEGTDGEGDCPRQMEFLPLIQRTWEMPVRGSCMFQLMQKLRTTKEVLRGFHKCHFADLDARIQAAKEHLNQA